MRSPDLQLGTLSTEAMFAVLAFSQLLLITSVPDETEEAVQ